MRLMVLLLLLLPGVITQAQDDLAPFIHYYDWIHGGLVIERADGTQSRIYTDLIPKEHNSVRMRGWSPSGRWFVFSSYFTYGEGDGYQQQTQIVSSDGQQRIDLGSHRQLYAQWSTHKDILLVLYVKDTQDDTVHFRLIDVEHHTDLAETQLQEWGLELPGQPSVEWGTNGLDAFVEWSRYKMILTHNGFTEVQIEGIGSVVAIRSGFDVGRLLDVDIVTHESSVTLTFGDKADDQRIEIVDDATGRPENPYHIHWSPTLENALIYAEPCSDGSCEGWLKLIYWKTGAVVSITPIFDVKVDYRDCFEKNFCSGIWSFDGNFAVLINERGQAYILDVVSGTTRVIGSVQQVAYYRWTADEHLYLFFEGNPILHHFDVPADEREEIEIGVDVRFYEVYPSPDGQHLGLISLPITVINQHGDVMVQSPPHSHSTQSYNYPSNGYEWHPNSQWAMANYSISFAGGGGGPEASVVFDLAGTTRRELPTGGDAGFVPDAAVQHLTPSQALSLKPDPVYILPQDGIVWGVGWHPTDPDQLVTYSPDAGLVFWSLAGDKPHITEQMIPETRPTSPLPFGLRLAWLPDQNMVGYYDEGGIIDSKTGEHLTVPEGNFPLVERNDSKVMLHCSGSEQSIELDEDSTANTSQYMVTCGQMTVLYHLPIAGELLQYVDMASGKITLLEIGDNYETGDVQDGLAVMGSRYNCCFAVADITTGEVLDKLYGTAYSLALSPDGRWLATTSSGMTAIWDMSKYSAGQQ